MTNINIIPESALNFRLNCCCEACQTSFSVDFDAHDNKGRPQRDWPEKLKTLFCPKCGHKHSGKKTIYRCVRSNTDLCPCGYTNCQNCHEWLPVFSEGRPSLVEFPAMHMQLLRSIRTLHANARVNALVVEYQRAVLAESSSETQQASQQADIRSRFRLAAASEP